MGDKEKFVTHGKMGHTWKSRSLLEKWVKIVKCVTVGKMGHIW